MTTSNIFEEPKKRVLVVDDDAGLRMTVSMTLRNTGRFDVEEAVDGVHAVEKFQEQHDANKRYDMVILDVDMPRMTGLEALQKIKQIDPSTIVLILTAFANIDDAVKAVKEGAQVEIGGNERYVALCRKHWMEAMQ